MPRYNPYFFQTLSDAPRLTPQVLANQVDGVLLLLGGFPLHASGALDVPTPEHPTCRDYSDAARRAVERGTWSREEAGALLLLLLVSKLRGVLVSRDTSSCSELHSAIQKSLPKLLNDLRRGYVLVLPDDPYACRAWNSGEASLTILARTAAKLALRATRPKPETLYRLVGSIIYMIGVVYRFTPAYCLTAVAAGLASDKLEDFCSIPAGDLIAMLSDWMLRTSPGRFIAGELLEATDISDQRRVALLLAAHVALLCRAADTIRSSGGGPELVRQVVKSIGTSLELLDPSIYLEDIAALGVPGEYLEEEVEACLARCPRRRSKLQSTS